jgi:hypothetical protein
MTDDPMWDELFHSVAFAAFVAVAQEQGGWPDREAVRRRAYNIYEDALAERNAGKSVTQLAEKGAAP